VKLEVTEALGLELVEREPVPLLQKVGLPELDALGEAPGEEEGESVPEEHTEAVAEAQEETDRLELELSVPLVHCEGVGLTLLLAEEARDADTLPVTHVVTDTVLVAD
jgi:hypothetical protein